MRHQKARHHLVVVRWVAGMRRMARARNDHGRVTLQTTGELIGDQLKHARAAFAPDEQHRRRDSPELGAGHRRKVLLATGEHFVSQLEGVCEHVSAGRWGELVEPAPSAYGVVECAQSRDRVTARESGPGGIEGVRIESAPRRVSRFGGGEKWADRKLGQDERAHELWMVVRL